MAAGVAAKPLSGLGTPASLSILPGYGTLGAHSTVAVGTPLRTPADLSMSAGLGTPAAPSKSAVPSTNQHRNTCEYTAHTETRTKTAGHTAH